jgi:LysM repeat protein
MKMLARVGLCLAVLGMTLGSVQAVAARSAVGAGGWEILGEHTVRVGETLYCIGRAYGVDPAAIATQNDIITMNLIRPGQLLSIPDVPKALHRGPVCVPQFGEDLPEPPPSERVCGGCDCRLTHVIRWGDTLSWISIHYGVDMWSIAECNCVRNLNFIRAGASLCIP